MTQDGKVARMVACIAEIPNRLSSQVATVVEASCARVCVSSTHPAKCFLTLTSHSPVLHPLNRLIVGRAGGEGGFGGGGDGKGGAGGGGDDGGGDGG